MQRQRAEMTEASCLRVKSTASFGTGELCMWDPTFEEPCTMAPLEGSDEFYAELQVMVIGVALTLPLIRLVEVMSDRYLFAPLRGEAEDDGDGGSPGAARLLANLGLDAELAAGARDPRRAAAAHTLPPGTGRAAASC